METGTLQHGAMFLYSNDSLRKTIGEGVINAGYAYVTRDSHFKCSNISFSECKLDGMDFQL